MVDLGLEVNERLIVLSWFSWEMAEKKLRIPDAYLTYKLA